MVVQLMVLFLDPGEGDSPSTTPLAAAVGCCWGPFRMSVASMAMPAPSAEHLQRVVRAYQEFKDEPKDEPGFTRVVPIEEIRAKEGSLNITLYICAETQAQTDADSVTATTALPKVPTEWLQSSQQIRKSLAALGI